MFSINCKPMIFRSTADASYLLIHFQISSDEIILDTSIMDNSGENTFMQKRLTYGKSGSSSSTTITVLASQTEQPSYSLQCSTSANATLNNVNPASPNTSCIALQFSTEFYHFGGSGRKKTEESKETNVCYIFINKEGRHYVRCKACYECPSVC